jgi:hypothetical protein
MSPVIELASFWNALHFLLVFWIVMSAGLLFFTRGFLRAVTRRRVDFSTGAIWVYRFLGFVNMAGALHLLVGGKG